MTEQKGGQVKPESRAPLPIVSFSLTVRNLTWVAKRAGELGISRSEYVRRVLSKDEDVGVKGSAA